MSKRNMSRTRRRIHRQLINHSPAINRHYLFEVEHEKDGWFNVYFQHTEVYSALFENEQDFTDIVSTCCWVSSAALAWVISGKTDLPSNDDFSREPPQDKEAYVVRTTPLGTARGGNPNSCYHEMVVWDGYLWSSFLSETCMRRLEFQVPKDKSGWLEVEPHLLETIPDDEIDQKLVDTVFLPLDVSSNNEILGRMSKAIGCLSKHVS